MLLLVAVREFFYSRYFLFFFLLPIILLFIATALVLGFSAKSTQGKLASYEMLSWVGNDDSVRYDVPRLAAHSSCLSNRQQLLLDQINQGSTISFQEISQIIYERHEEAYWRELYPILKSKNTKAVNKLRQKIFSAQEIFRKTISPEVPILDSMQIKAQAEILLRKQHRGKRLMVNRERINLLDIFLEGKIQPYSATVWYQLISRSMGPLEFRDRHQVVIFEEGILSPGYMVREGDAWLLYGLDTTLEGSGGPTFYGDTRLLRGAIRILDAELFALAEAFSGCLHNAGLFRQASLEFTAKRYSIQLENLDEVNFHVDSFQKANPQALVGVRYVGSGYAKARDPKRELGATIFGFSQSNLGPGDRPQGIRGHLVDKRPLYSQHSGVYLADTEQQGLQNAVQSFTGLFVGDTQSTPVEVAALTEAEALENIEKPIDTNKELLLELALPKNIVFEAVAPESITIPVQIGRAGMACDLKAVNPVSANSIAQLDDSGNSVTDLLQFDFVELKQENPTFSEGISFQGKLGKQSESKLLQDIRFRLDCRVAGLEKLRHSLRAYFVGHSFTENPEVSVKATKKL